MCQYKTEYSCFANIKLNIILVCCTQAYMDFFSEALQAEVANKGITVQVGVQVLLVWFQDLSD